MHFYNLIYNVFNMSVARNCDSSNVLFQMAGYSYYIHGHEILDIHSPQSKMYSTTSRVDICGTKWDVLTVVWPFHLELMNY